MLDVKDFAPGVELREGNYLFPQRDQNWRRELFPQEVMEHPAKNNLYVIKALVEYISKPYQTILDPFGGTGSTMIAATLSRNVKLIEIEKVYQDIINKTADSWMQDKVATGSIEVLYGDCRSLLPQPCDHIIFSPPFSNSLYRPGAALDERTQRQTDAYSAGSSENMGNLGRLNTFQYGLEMSKLYPKLYASVKPGGYMAILHRDQMKGKERIMHSATTMKGAFAAGFVLQNLFSWLPPGAKQSRVAKSKGGNIVENEDIIIFRRNE